MNDTIDFNDEIEVYTKDCFFEAGRILIHLAKRTQTSVLVCILKIKDYKVLKNYFGTNTVDKLLHVISGEVKEKGRASDLIAYMGNGEVAMTYYGITNSDAKIMLDNILEGLKKSRHTIDNREININVTIGGRVMHPRTNHVSLATLYEQAELVLQSAVEADDTNVIIH